MGKVSGVGINDVLEVLRKALVKSIHVDSTVDNPQESKDLIGSQVFDYLLLNAWVDLNLGTFLLDGASLSQEVVVNLVQRDMTASNQVIQVVKTWRFVLDEHKQQMRGQANKSLLLTSLIDGRYVR